MLPILTPPLPYSDFPRLSLSHSSFVNKMGSYLRTRPRALLSWLSFPINSTRLASQSSKTRCQADTTDVLIFKDPPPQYWEE